MKVKRLTAYSGMMLSSWSALTACKVSVSVNIYSQLGPGVSHTLAGIFAVANVRIRDMVRMVWLFSKQ